MRVQLLRCGCKACVVVVVATECPAHGLSAQQACLDRRSLQSFGASSSAGSSCFGSSKEGVIKDWSTQGVKPMWIWDALLQRFSIIAATAPTLVIVQRFTHHHVTGRFGGSDVLDAIRHESGVLPLQAKKRKWLFVYFSN
ncbi:hypothetical protein PPTG_22336 [Phytophthora nicotianae INRA-310]|uniref:Secreted protein n=1 Tax=Phytophthora nicotianae (strain INRA-310) TaxID=761204 RepID=W2QM84_PHYN3|nr:hypothetical protein PPTG_22336 [Phytophthora nicotianae INRA-310]ETN13340.1 hypothetical protein PPTG_22336 [Phytophthora nicotianae INRA-310]